MDDMIKATGGGVHASIVLAESQSALATAAHITAKHGEICLVAAVRPFACSRASADLVKPKESWQISGLWLIHKDLKFTGETSEMQFRLS